MNHANYSWKFRQAKETRKWIRTFFCDLRRVYDQGFISSAVYKLFALPNQFYEGKSIIFCQFLTQQKKNLDLFFIF